MTQRRTAMRAQLREAYREAILEAAERAFVRRGFSGIRLADVAREAGVAVATLYNYFSNKTDVFQSLLELRGDQLLGRLRQIAHDTAEPRERLELLIRTAIESIQATAGTYAVAFELGGVSEVSIRRLGGHVAQRQYRDYLRLLEEAIAEAMRAGVLRDDLSPDVLATFLGGEMNGFFHKWLAEGQSDDLNDYIETVIALFFEGAGR